MVYNGQGEIGLVLAVNFFPKKGLVQAIDLEVAIKFVYNFWVIYKVKYNGHSQKSRSGH